MANKFEEPQHSTPTNNGLGKAALAALGLILILMALANWFFYTPQGKEISHYYPALSGSIYAAVLVGTFFSSIAIAISFGKRVILLPFLVGPLTVVLLGDPPGKQTMYGDIGGLIFGFYLFVVCGIGSIIGALASNPANGNGDS